jgi:hypothetical protein
VIGKIQRWLLDRRAARQAHDAAWAGHIGQDPLSINGFMRLVRDKLSAGAAPLEFQESTIGGSEILLVAEIPGTSAVLYVAGDGAQIHDGDKELFWSEHYDFPGPDELATAIVSRVAELRQHQP